MYKAYDCLSYETIYNYKNKILHLQNFMHNLVHEILKRIKSSLSYKSNIVFLNGNASFLSSSSFEQRKRSIWFELLMVLLCKSTACSRETYTKSLRKNVFYCFLLIKSTVVSVFLTRHGYHSVNIMRRYLSVTWLVLALSTCLHICYLARIYHSAI